MAIIIKGKTFTATEQVTSTKLHQLVDSATFDPAAADGSTLEVSAGALRIKAGGVSNSEIANGAITPAKFSSGGNLGWRNLIINGRGFINQRAYVSATATTGSNEYTLDRWRVVTSGQNLSFSISGITATMTAPAGGVEQVIEGNSIQGGTHVISFTGTATCTVDGASKVSGGTFTLTAGTNCTVKFSSGTFTNVQVEFGSVASSYENKPYGIELGLCQRYYGRCTTQVTNFSTSPSKGVFYKTSMRAVPTISGGGAGFTTTNSTTDGFDCGQTAAANQTLTFSAEI